jgi:diphosphomevalonate decarboxylase
MTRTTAVACSNIALAKYWGKADERENLPAVPSLSLTLAGLETRTTVEIDPGLDVDVAEIDGLPATGRPRDRIVALLDRVRALAGLDTRVRVQSRNDFPTAAGLASSASGFAALALAATRAAGLDLPLAQVSALARQASASAARSLFGGFVALRGPQAEPLAPPEHWALSMIVAVTQAGPKTVSSTAGMQHTSATSPYYPAWVAQAPGLFEAVRCSIEERDLARLGTAMEQSALMMHATMLAAQPALCYFTPATWAALQCVRDLRAADVAAYFTIDAGPHVKVITDRASETRVQSALENVPGVLRTILCHPGPGARIVP